MSYTAKVDPCFIPDSEAFDERMAIMVHEGGIPTEQAKDLAAQAQGLRRKEEVGLGPRLKNKPASQSGGLGMHQYVTDNRHHPTQKQFASAILKFFRKTIPNEWKSFPD